MDAAGLLEQYKYDTTNLPSEMKFLVQELKIKDAIFQKHVEELDNLEQQLSKYSKGNTPHPKEDQVARRIEELYDLIEKEENEKGIMSNTVLWSVSKHLVKLQSDIDDLVKKGIIDGWDVKFSDDKDRGVISLISDPDEDLTTSADVKMEDSSNYRRKRTPTQSRAVTPMSADESISNNRPLGPPRRREVTAGTVMRSIPRSNRRNLNDNNDGDGDNEDDELYCFCQQVSFGAMVACDNPQCKYEWFHYSCVGLKAQPDGVWYCPECRKDRTNRKERRNRK